jgi:putative oxidoreductase
MTSVLLGSVVDSDYSVDQMNGGLLMLRLCLGLFLAYHGYNKVFGGGGLSGTAGWFGSIGMKWPTWQARLAATTEIGAGVMLAAGLLTPLAAAGIIGVMLVAIVVAHGKVGFFIFLPNQGWEYCATIALGALAVGIMGPGQWSLDEAIGVSFNGWSGLVIAGVVGVGGAGLQLATSYRPTPSPTDS